MFCTAFIQCAWERMGILRRRSYHCRLACHRANVSFLRHVALIINTATTVVTFLMVFMIQNTQNRDAKAMHLKLDELIRAVQGARNQLVDLENLSDDDLTKLEEQFQRLRKQAENSRIGFHSGEPAKSR